MSLLSWCAFDDLPVGQCSCKEHRPDLNEKPKPPENASLIGMVLWDQ